MPFGVATYAVVALLASSNIPTPLYPVYERDFGLSPLVITLVFATYALVVIPSLLFFGPLSDAFGRRRVLLPALGGAMVSMALFAAAGSASWLFAAQAVEGVALGALQGTASPALIEVDPTDRRQRASAVASGATVGGAALGPLLAGLLAQYGPIGRRLPYLVELGLLAVALVAVMRYFPHDIRRQPWRPRRPSVPAEIRRPFIVAGISTFVAWAVTALFLSLIPSFTQTIAGTHNVAVPGAIVASMLATSAVIQVFGQRWPSLPAQTAGLALIGAGLIGLIAAAQTKVLAVLLAAAVLAGLGLGLAFMGALGDVNAMAPEDRKGDIVASFYVVTYVGTALPVIGVGLIALATGVLTAVQIFGYVGVVTCTFGLVALTVEQRRQRAMGGQTDPSL